MDGLKLLFEGKQFAQLIPNKDWPGVLCVSYTQSKTLCLLTISESDSDINPARAPGWFLPDRDVALPVDLRDSRWSICLENTYDEFW